MESTPEAPVENKAPVNEFGTAPNPPQVPHIAPNLPASQAYGVPMTHGGLGQATMSAYGGLGQAALAAGMAMPEFVNLLKKADKVDELKDDILRLKEEINKHKDENHSLVIKNRDLDSKVSNAQQQQEIAVKLAQLEKKGFLDSEAAQKMLESLPLILQSMSGAGQQGAPQPALGAANGLSEDKQRFMGYISDDMCTREMVQILEVTLMRLANIPQYKTDLQQLNLKEYGQAPNGNG